MALASAGLVIFVNSSMFAPAMKPALLPERITAPFGGSRSRVSSTAENSSSTSRPRVLAEESATSSVIQARPSASRLICQCLKPCMKAPSDSFFECVFVGHEGHGDAARSGMYAAGNALRRQMHLHASRIGSLLQALIARHVLDGLGVAAVADA